MNKSQILPNSFKSKVPRKRKQKIKPNRITNKSKMNNPYQNAKETRITS